eukprot:1308489-Pyramimonas_sp.AAC.1
MAVTLVAATVAGLRWTVTQAGLTMGATMAGASAPAARQPQAHDADIRLLLVGKRTKAWRTLGMCSRPAYRT